MAVPEGMDLDQDALIAAADLVGRAGAKELEIGYVHDDVPMEEAGWYAHAQYQGARVTVEASGPIEAAEGLARRLLTGATCRRCGKRIRLADGEGCRWTRMGKRYEPGCDLPIDQSIPVPPEVQRR